ncbi:MAG: hypothetical protein HZC02_02220 [Candidatus Levybacteria bacterium]|nr:hypothetical protein [Candidatus Levybacteria bacterium]
MSNLLETSPRIDPSVKEQADAILASLPKDREAATARWEEVGRQDKASLSLRAREIATLGFFPSILVEETKPDMFVNKEDEQPPQYRRAIWVQGPERDPETGFGYAGAVVMDDEGTLWKGFAGRDGGGEIDSFGFESAQEVHLEDYPGYAVHARNSMQALLEERTGIAARRWEKEQAERLVRDKQSIEKENEKYVGKTDLREGNTDDIGEKANEHMVQIAKMSEMVKSPNSAITPEQYVNILGHILSAQDFSEFPGSDMVMSTGARELGFVAGSLVAVLDEDLGKELYALMKEMWESFAGSTYRIRRVFQTPLQDTPEDGRIYTAFGWHAYDRQSSGDSFFSLPEFGELPDAFRVGEDGTISIEEVTDWLLNTSPPSLQEE